MDMRRLRRYVATPMTGMPIRPDMNENFECDHHQTIREMEQYDCITRRPIEKNMKISRINYTASGFQYSESFFLS